MTPLASTTAPPIPEKTERLFPSRSCHEPSLDPAAARARVHDSDLEPAVRVGTVYAAHDSGAWCVAGATANHVLDAHRRSDVLVAMAGRAHRPLWTPVVAFRRRRHCR